MKYLMLVAGVLVMLSMSSSVQGAVVLTLNGDNPLAVNYHSSFVDPGARVTAPPSAIAAGSLHSLALKADRTVVGWGDNVYGLVDIPTSATNVVGISAGAVHSLALKADGSVIGWGADFDGGINIPSSATNVVAIAAGNNSTSLALRADGSVVGWGYNPYGQIPLSATNVVAIAAGWDFSLVLRADGSVEGFGQNFWGAINIPSSATNVVAISAGFYGGIALKADGSIVDWGYDGFVPINIPSSVTNVIAVSAGTFHNLALKADGTVIGWGRESYGQNSVPLTASNVVAIADGQTHSLALNADGLVVGWGNNVFGQVDIPASVTNLAIPVDVAGKVDTDTPGFYILTYTATNLLGTTITATRTVQVLAPQPVFLSVAQANGTIDFSWSALTGQKYQVQYITDLVSINWMDLGSTITANNVILSASDVVGTDMQRFYRVVVRP